MNNFLMLWAGTIFVSLVVACTSNPVYIQNRLPLPDSPTLPPVDIAIGQPLTKEVARDITVRDRLHLGYEADLREVIKSTWGDK